MRLKYLKEAAVTELRREIDANGKRYIHDETWLDDFFGERNYLAESQLEIEDVPELQRPQNSEELFEFQNVVSLHTALKNLTPSQASDERLWCWLAHGPYWNYMRARWPADSAKNMKRYVLEHYFLTDARGLVRNGIARLWWFGHATYDECDEDPYRLTRLLLETTDARQSITERQFWRNKRVLSALLNRVQHWQDKGLNFYVPRERFRRLCKTFNLYGGTMLLDTLNEIDLNALIDDFASSENSSAVTYE